MGVEEMQEGERGSVGERETWFDKEVVPEDLVRWLV